MRGVVGRDSAVLERSIRYVNMQSQIMYAYILICIFVSLHLHLDVQDMYVQSLERVLDIVIQSSHGYLKPRIQIKSPGTECSQRKGEIDLIEDRSRPGYLRVDLLETSDCRDNRRHLPRLSPQMLSPCKQNTPPEPARVGVSLGKTPQGRLCLIHFCASSP